MKTRELRRDQFPKQKSIITGCSTPDSQRWMQNKTGLTKHNGINSASTQTAPEMIWDEPWSGARHTLSILISNSRKIHDLPIHIPNKCDNWYPPIQRHMLCSSSLCLSFGASAPDMNYYHIKPAKYARFCCWPNKTTAIQWWWMGACLLHHMYDYVRIACQICAVRPVLCPFPLLSVKQFAIAGTVGKHVPITCSFQHPRKPLTARASTSMQICFCSITVIIRRL